MGYPGTLPNPTRQGYGLEPQSGVERTGMEAGNARARQRFTRTPTHIPLRWVFTEAEFAVFEAWWKQVALEGAAWQDMPVANGGGITSVSARFIGPYKASMLGLGYEVAARVEVQALPQLTAEELEVASAYGLTDIAYASPALHTLIHTTLPAYW